jgi:predicted enzyme related to lactoylglutathione lyase
MRTMILAMTAMTVAVAHAQSKPPTSMPADVGAGRVAWFDLTTTDLSKSKAFYGTLFDWTFNPIKGTDMAVEIVSGGAAIGTIRVAEGQISPFNGVAYVQVRDIQASCKKAGELGGKLVPGFPFDLPDSAGAVGLLTDPVGHPIGLYSRTSLASQKPGDVAAAVQSPQLTATNEERERRDQPVTADDVRILQKADELLGTEAVWNRQDDRECADDEKTGKRSLFCALHKASVDVLGDYDHRRVALQEVRFAVEDVTRGQEFQHRLRDFNNLPTTRLADVKSVLQVAMTRVKARLKNE